MLLKKFLKDYRIILASGSPRRKELLEESEIDFCQSPNYEVEEVCPEGTSTFDVPRYLSELKANHYPYKVEKRDIIITADTVVIIDEEILGKPASREDAIVMLEKLSGREHIVMTAYTLRTAHGLNTYSVETKVKFTHLEMEDIIYYVDRYRPFDKAGSYGIQEWIGYIGVESISGSFYNVMGLPVHALLCSIKEIVTPLEETTEV